jgi:hypothetical protein
MRPEAGAFDLVQGSLSLAAAPAHKFSGLRALGPAGGFFADPQFASECGTLSGTKLRQTLAGNQRMLRHTQT